MLKIICYFILLGLATSDESIELTEPRIVGGQDVDIRDFPYQVGIFYGRILWCGGSVYTQRVIITAAHCVKIFRPSDLKIVAGETRLSSRKTEYEILKFIVHENYATTQYDYDIALIVLKNPLTFSNAIQPIALEKEKLPTDTQAVVTGWGETRSEKFSDHLKMARVLLISNDACVRSYAWIITRNMVCAGVPNGSKDACQGDSGGPLVVNNKLLGIVSFGAECGSIVNPGVYASVPEYYDWILTNTAQIHLVS